MTDDNMESEETTGGIKQWVEDNLRLIVSIIIVVAIAGGIYSYSQRSKQAELALNEEDETQEQTLIGNDEEKDDQQPQENDVVKEEKKEPEPQAVKPDTDANKGNETAPEKTPEKSPEQNPEKAPQKPQASSTTTITEETANAFVETAKRGDGTTHLARRILANYLEKTPNSKLTREHKIYIEDYMRKHVSHKGGLNPGTKLEFSKSLIQDAITKAESLNANQLKNLEKYAKRVPSLT